MWRHLVTTTTRAPRYAMSHSVNKLVAEQQNDMFFGSEVINRVSFLREDADFIANAATHPLARYIAFKGGDPLINKTLRHKLVVLANGDYQVGDASGLWRDPKWRVLIETWCRDNRDAARDTRAPGKPVVLFMGLEDESVGLDLAALKADEREERYLDHQGRYQGIPYFAVDVTAADDVAEAFVAAAAAAAPAAEAAPTEALEVPGNTTADALDAAEAAAARAAAGTKAAATAAPSPAIFFTHSRKHYLGFTHREAALYLHAKMLFDWLSRNLFCPGCGSAVIPINAGGKLRCTNDATRDDRPACPVKRASVSNVTFPRTDCVIITAITNRDRSKILLLLLKRYAATRMYACTAGFVEPAETIEVATKREIWEETGVVCHQINIVMTQPWPFPANLMIGCMGVVDFDGVSENIHLGHDRELADARWFDTDLIRKWIYEDKTVDNPEGIVLPNPESIAFLLIKMAVDQRQQKL
jgi:NAD+ diphosphatase